MSLLLLGPVLASSRNSWTYAARERLDQRAPVAPGAALIATRSMLLSNAVFAQPGGGVLRGSQPRNGRLMFTRVASGESRGAARVRYRP